MSERTSISRIAVLAALTVVGVVGAASSSKADVTYVVSATFDDGATLSGSFVIDVYGYPLNADTNLVTTSGPVIPGYTYSVTTAYGDGCIGPCIAYGSVTPAYYQNLQLTFLNPLGSYGPDPIVGGEGGPSFENYAYSGQIRYITSGVATGVPESSTWLMMFGGFAGLGYVAFRSSKTRRVQPSIA